MTRYFMHLRDSTDEVLDAEGSHYRDLEDLRAAVMSSARDIIAGDVRKGVVDFRYRIDAENEGGDVIYTLPFKHAVTITPEA